jgi:hypothetical protein
MQAIIGAFAAASRWQEKARMEDGAETFLSILDPPSSILVFIFLAFLASWRDSSHEMTEECGAVLRRTSAGFDCAHHKSARAVGRELA